MTIFQKFKKKMAALDISAMMWHIICSHIEGGQMPLSGEEDLDRKLLAIYEDQKILSFEQFIFGRLLGNFLPVVQYQKKNFELSSYPKIWVFLLHYVSEIWRVRGDLVSIKIQNSTKFNALQEVERLLDNNDITYVNAGNKSLFENCPDSRWPLSRIQSWLRSVRSSVEIGKRFAFSNQPRITAYIPKK